MKSSLRDYVYESIMNDIINDEFTPFQIITERSIIEKYNCSKSPVREAMLSLCNDNILRSIPRCGYEVLPVSIEDLTQLLNSRFLLEGGFLKISIDLITDEQIDVLEQLTALLPAQQDDVWKYWDLNTRFHLELISIANNHTAYSDLIRICSRLKIAYAILNKGQKAADKSYFEPIKHRRIIESLRKRDKALALSALRTDLSDFGSAHVELQNFFD